MNDCFDNTRFKLEIVSIRQESNSNISNGVNFNTTEKRKKERKRIEEIFKKNFQTTTICQEGKPDSKIGAKYSEINAREKKEATNGGIYIHLNKERQSEITDRKS